MVPLLTTVRPAGIVASLPKAGNPLLQFPASAQSLLMAPVNVVWEKVDVAKRQHSPRERKTTRFFIIVFKCLCKDRDSALVCSQHTTTSSPLLLTRSMHVCKHGTGVDFCSVDCSITRNRKHTWSCMPGEGIWVSWKEKKSGSWSAG